MIKALFESKGIGFRVDFRIQPFHESALGSCFHTDEVIQYNCISESKNEAIDKIIEKLKELRDGEK